MSAWSLSVAEPIPLSGKNQTPVEWKAPAFFGIFVLANGLRTEQRRQAMLTSPKFALALVFVLATASAVTAAPKQPVRPNTAIQQQVPTGSHLSLDSIATGSVASTGSVDKPGNISPQGYDRLKRLMEDFEDLGS